MSILDANRSEERRVARIMGATARVSHNFARYPALLHGECHTGPVHRTQLGGLCLNIGLIHRTFAVLHRQNNNKSNCLKWIIYVAVFFLNRPGECSMTSGEPHPFRWCDIQIYMGQLQLDVF